MLMNMEKLLAVANKNNFAVPAFNISDWGMLQGIFEISEEKKAPVIIAIHPNELKLVGRELMKAVIERARNSFLPVAINLDHGASLEDIIVAIQDGFTSVMIDGSQLPFAGNAALCREVVRVAHAAGVSVEGELGTIGSTDKEAEEGNKIIYTDPDDAAKLVRETGIDALAIAIGTSHGLYPKGFVPKLNLDLLKKIKAKVSIPLVLHGGSDNHDNEIAESVNLGINKINISSDIKAAYYKKMREVLKDESVRTPASATPPCVAAMKEVAAHKIDLFRAGGKAQLYK
ncbi:MAG: ketose-bisphosphate aldolase [Treponema sp.]|nr:ketose-bisphosphate aldolase [Treponema sp.]